VNDGAARVLTFLRRTGGPSQSGVDLSQSLGVSRAQIWKHVETLRARGYHIDALRGEGYRLIATPDRLYPEQINDGLETRWLGRNLHWLNETDSTNRVAIEQAGLGAPHGTAIIAETQSGGKGRLGRTFYSPAFQNLYTSILLRPDVTTEKAPAFIQASAVAVANTVAEVIGDDDAVEIKWPNDVLLGGLKTSGILVELSAEATRVAHLVLGIGVNLNVDRQDFPDEFRERATSLRSHLGRPVDRVSFTQRLFAHLEEILDVCCQKGFNEVRPRFEARFRMPGRRVRIQEVGSADREGTVLGIDDMGALLLTLDDGRVERVLAGDVTLAKEPT
jgi:BirA family biotin operon repressor/biotin-[acetyl-CoA-carboxylase] ligase